MTIARLAPAIPTVTTVDVPVRDAKDSGDLKWALDEVRSKINLIRLRDAYYNGDHRLSFATEAWRTEFGKMLKAFNANYCPAVVDAVADRMRLIGVDVARGNDRDETLTDRLNVIWQDNRMDRRAGQIHTAMLKHAEVYVTVWTHPVTERVMYHIGRGDRIAVRYSTTDPDEIELAAKVWMEANRVRATLYYPDHIERWATRKQSVFTGLPPGVTGFEPYDEDDDGWWVEHDFGVVPVVPFVNNPTEDGKGRSELDDVIPLQDALNIAMADMLVALEFAAYPQRWAVGLMETRDPETGQVEDSLKAGVERMWTSSSPETKFGQFDTAQMTNFVTAQDAIRADIARVSRTPVNYLLMSNTPVSGEALRIMEMPLMAKVTDRMDSTAPAWESLARVSLVVDNTVAPEDRDIRFTANWRDTATRGDLQHAMTIRQKRDLGISERQGLRELGYEDSLIEQMDDERLEERATSGDVADAALTAFSRGDATGGLG